MAFHDLDQIPPREIAPGYHAKFIHSEKMTVVYWEVEEGAALPEHHHPHEQIANVLEGEFELIVEDETYTLTPGQVVVIPGDVPHSGRAITACRLVDIFQPVREDYR